MFERIRSALFVFALLAAGCISARAAPDGWRTLRADHFTLQGDASEIQLREAARRLEEFRFAVSQIYPKLRLDVPGVPTNIVLFKDAASFQPFRPLRPNGTLDDVVAGYFQAGDDANYIVTAIGGQKGDPAGTVFHEYTHFLVRVNFGEDDVPPWVDEGLAEYFETFRLADEKTAVLGGRPIGVSSALDATSIAPPEAMFATDDAGLQSGTRGSRAAFYAESWALVHYLMHAQPGRDRYETLASLLTDSQAAETAVTKAFGTDAAAFGRALIAYANQAALPKSELALANKPATTVPSATTTLSEADANARLGDLLLHLDRRDEAGVYLRKALAASPNSPSANASLGMLLMQLDNFVEGRKYLEKAIAAGNTDHFVAFDLAWAIIRAAMNANREVEDFQPDVAKRLGELLQRSIDAAPEFAGSRRLLAFVKMVEGDDLAGAAELAKKAIELEPGDDEHRLLLARILLRREKYQEARSSAEKIAFLATDVRVRAEASEIVKAADEYFAARNQPPPDRILTVFNPRPPLILKRSTVSEAEIARFEEDRVQNNLNRILPRPRTGERQAVGYINGVRCTADGRVEYDVTADEQRSVFTSRDFSSLRLSILIEGESSFKIDCDAKFGKQLTVLTYRPPDILKPSARPELVAVAFVPANFRLKSPEEMAKARLVIVEDDTLSSRGRRKP